MPQHLWIIIPQWEQFQHRDAARASVPTWIKLYTQLLHDDEYMSLSGHDRAVLHGLWLEYASSRRRLRLDTRSISSRLRLRVTMATIERLNHAGFLSISASRHASLEVEEKREELRAVRSKTTEDPAPNGGGNGTAPTFSINELTPKLRSIT